MARSPPSDHFWPITMQGGEPCIPTEHSALLAKFTVAASASTIAVVEARRIDGDKSWYLSGCGVTYN